MNSLQNIYIHSQKIRIYLNVFGFITLTNFAKDLGVFRFHNFLLIKQTDLVPEYTIMFTGK